MLTNSQIESGRYAFVRHRTLTRQGIWLIPFSLIVVSAGSTITFMRFNFRNDSGSERVQMIIASASIRHLYYFPKNATDPNLQYDSLNETNIRSRGIRAG